MSLLSELSTIVGEAFAAEGIDPSYGGVVVSQRPEFAAVSGERGHGRGQSHRIGSTGTRSADC